MPQNLDISCPKCGEGFLLNETLAGPTVARIRQEADLSIKKAREEAEARIADVHALEGTLATKQLDLAEKEASVNALVNQAMVAERSRIAATERESILRELSPEIEAERAKAKGLEEKLATAQKAELGLRQEKEGVDRRAQDLELEVARKVDEQRKAIHAQACKETQEAAELKLAEAEIKLTELQNEAQEKRALTSALSATLAAKELELSEKEASVATQVNQAIAVERQRISFAERENVLKELTPELEAERAKAKEYKAKLELAQSAELQLRQEKEAIDERSQNLELEVARKVDEQRKAIHELASKESEETARLKIAEKDKTISDMQLKLQEAQRKATQGSQQLQGEVLELDFESTLRQVFPQDIIEPVKTGSRGGDVLQRVLGQMTRPVGTIFWEIKRAQSWGGDWTKKAKQDAAEAKAEVTLIVSEVLPKGVKDFGLHEEIWCVVPAHAVMLGLAIRQGIITTAEARQGAAGRETKKERLYDYMIGPEFRATLEGIALPFKELHDELTAEKRATLTRWRRQEKRLERVLTNIAALQGDLQGIAGSEMPQIAGFELDAPDKNLLES